MKLPLTMLLRQDFRSWKLAFPAGDYAPAALPVARRSNDFGQGEQTDQHRDEIQAAHQLNLAEHETVGAIDQIKTDRCRMRPSAAEPSP